MPRDRKLVGIYFRECRQALGLSLLEESNLLGLDNPETISRWEKGLEFPSAQLLSKIPDVYQISAFEWNSILENEVDE